MSETIQELYELSEHAQDAVNRAAALAKTDEKRPRIHFHSPSQWMDDPNGIIYHDGYYHMMYSLNPNSCLHRAGMVYKTKHRVWDPNHPDWTGGITVWGHARSRDLIHWEHLPIALYPSISRGEHFIWFGTTTINDNGDPVAVYTSVGPQKRPEDTADQWMQISGPDMVRWKPVEHNPVLSYDAHGDQRLTEWRDPFFVKDSGKTYLILGAKLPQEEGGDGVIAMYEAQNREYSEWRYRGILFRHRDKRVPSIECPNLVKVDGQWVILLSPHREVEYYVGEVDFANCRFVVKTQGIVDHSTNFYATNVLTDRDGRSLMWGALEGFKGTKGWNGCVSLPRCLHVDQNGRLIQEPVNELEALRSSKVCFEQTLSGGETVKIGDVREGTAEIRLRFPSQAEASIRLDAEAAGAGGVTIKAGRGYLEIEDKKMALLGDGKERSVTIYVDRTVIEVYTDYGECLSAVLPGPVLDCGVYLLTEGCAHIGMEVYQLCADQLIV